jgi:hypothetical protein
MYTQIRACTYITIFQAPHVEKRTALDLVALAAALAFAAYFYVANKTTIVAFIWRGFTEIGPEHVRVIVLLQFKLVTLGTCVCQQDPAHHPLQ